MRVEFLVEFTDVSNRRLRTSHGSCWDDHLEDCVNRVFRDAAKASKKLR
jgi:hypothetical protein